MTARNTCPPHYSYSNIQPWDVIDAWGLDYYMWKFAMEALDAFSNGYEKLFQRAGNGVK